MPTVLQFPRERQPELPRNAPRRTRTRYYAHRVKESLTTRFAMCVCSIFLSLLLIAGVVIFILWLSLRPHRPRFHLESFTLIQPGSSVSFNMSDRNPNQKIGIYYGDVNGSVYYYDQVIASGPVVAGFFQQAKSTTLMVGQLGGAAGGSVQSQIADGLKTGRVPLRFELESVIRFKVKMWDTGEHRMHVSCELAVGVDGNLLPGYVDERCPIYF